MADYTVWDVNALLPGEPWTSAKAIAAFENLNAAFEGAPDAPRIEQPAIGSWYYTAGAVGTYAFAWRNSTATPPAFGATVAGSQLRPAGFTSESGVLPATSGTLFPSGSDIYGSDGAGRSALLGTWRCMGEAVQSATVIGNYPHTLWLRVS